MKLVKPAQYHGDTTTEATLDDLKAALKEYGMVVVDKESLLLLLGNMANSTQVPRYKRMAEAMIKAAEGRDNG